MAYIPLISELFEAIEHDKEGKRRKEIGIRVDKELKETRLKREEQTKRDIFRRLKFGISCMDCYFYRTSSDSGKEFCKKLPNKADVVRFSKVCDYFDDLTGRVIKIEISNMDSL
jgi:hypothetical protein